MNMNYKYNGFKLLSLKLIDTTLMGKSDLFYSFIESADSQDQIYTTVIIGPNGTGKSNLFRIIIELFKELEDLSKGKSRSYNVDGGFILKFAIDDNVYEYGNIAPENASSSDSPTYSYSKTAYLLGNGKLLDFKDVQLPKAIIASSIMLTDKYPFYKMDKIQEGNKISTSQRYKYLGVRNIAQNASTRAYVRRTVEYIVQNYKFDYFKEGLIEATKFLGLEKSIEISYPTSNTAIFFNGRLSPEGIEKYFEDIRKRYAYPGAIPPFKLDHYLKIREDSKQLASICDFCNKLVFEKRLTKFNYNTSIRKIVYNLLDDNSFGALNNEFPMLEQLRQLGLLAAPEIQLKREGDYSMQESSSGEYHFFSSVVGLLATMRTNSLIFVDEPEISLHPNWQMRYLSFLRQLFSASKNTSSHLVIATHSHFLISDLEADSSKIIGLTRENGQIEIVDLPESMDTYGWSAEDVLYRVFGVRTTRNYYIGVDIRELLSMISEGSRNKVQMCSIYDRLERVKLNQDDPLTLVLQKAKAYIDKL